MDSAGQLLMMAEQERTYQQKNKALFGPSVVAYLALGDGSGSVAQDISGNGRHGAYNGPTLAAVASPVPGLLAPSFDGVNDVIDVSAARNAIQASVAGGIMGWAKVPAWGGADRDIISLYASNDVDYFALRNGAAANTLLVFCVYGGVNLSFTLPCAPNDWFSYGFAWDKAADKFDFYLNGYNPYVTQHGLGVGVDAGDVNYCFLGGFGVGTNPFAGSQSDALFLTRWFSAAEHQAFTDNAGKVKKLAVLGDSIEVAWNSWNWIVASTRGLGLRNHATGGYAIVANSGMDINTAAAAGDDADAVIVAMGFNDDNSGNMTALQAKYESCLAAIRSTNPKATIYGLNVLPCWTNNTAGPAVDKSNIRTAIAAACAAKGVTCWDPFTVPWITQGQTSDGTHPTPAGHVAIAAQVLARLP